MIKSIRSNRQQKRNSQLSGNGRRLARDRRPAFLGMERMEERVMFSTYTVDSVLDDGPGSLRQAIINANDNAGADVIQFSLGATPATIEIEEALPEITEAVTIDADLGMVWVRKAQTASSIAYGLKFNSDDSVVQGLVISGFESNLVLTGSGNTVDGNWIGTDMTGAGVPEDTGTYGVEIHGNNNSVTNNVISGNGGDGVWVIGATAGTLIEDNVIGLDHTGMAPVIDPVSELPVQANGVTVGDYGGAYTSDVVIRNNVISGQAGNGVMVLDASMVTIVGNMIGVDKTGLAAASNRGSGVYLDGTASLVQIGGYTAADRNVISGNAGDGVTIWGGPGNLIIGNYIGTDKTGDALITQSVENWDGSISVYRGNSGNGISAYAASVIGLPGHGNVVSGNSAFGVYLNSDGSVVQGNRIGIGATGAATVGNNQEGIWIAGSGNLVGGVAAGEGNIIAYNGVFTDEASPGAGVTIESPFFDTYVRNSIRGNSIFSNAGLGIDHDGDGVTLNGDGATGTNANQLYPVIAEANYDTLAGTLHVIGTLGSDLTPLSGTTYALDLYVSVIGDTSGFGEGQTYIGTVNVTVPAGDWVIDEVIAIVAVPPNSILTATATDADGNTSEFSPHMVMTFSGTQDELPTTTTLTSSDMGDQTSVYGEEITFTATVTSDNTSDVPTGSIEFKDGETVLAVVPLNAAGKATLSVSLTALGNHQIAATYLPTGDFVASGASVTQLVNKAATTLALSTLSSVVYGQSVTFTANLAVVAPGVGIPTGTVAFFVDGDLIDTKTLDGLSASATATGLSAGTHAVRVVYSGDAFFLDSEANGLQTVDKAASELVLTSSPNPAALGESVLVTATVTSLAGAPTGWVLFTVDGEAFAPVDIFSGAASITLVGLAAGEHEITAAYAGNSNFQGSNDEATQQVEKAATTLTLASNLNPSMVGQEVTFIATLSGGVDGFELAGFVEFKAGGISLGTVLLQNGQASLTTSALEVGTHTITASWLGDSNYIASDAGLSQVVNKADTMLTLASSQNPAEVGQNVTFTATVTGDLAALSPTGTVVFKDGATVLGTGTLANGQATFSTAGLAAGSHVITAEFLGDANFNGDSDALTQVVNAPQTGGTLSGRTVRDVTGNGLTADDTAMAGVTVNLYLDKNNDGVLTSADGSAIATITSDAMGGYSFTSLTQGKYIVQEAVPTGYLRTTPALIGYYAATAADNTVISGLDFANYKVCPCPQYLSDVYYTINPGTPEEKVVTNLRGNTNEGDIVKATFTVLEPAQNMIVTLVSYTAPGGSFVAEDADLQKIYDLDTGVFGPGTHNLTVVIPDSYYQVDFVCGYAIDTFGPAGSNGFYTPQGRLISADNDGNNAYTGPQTVVHDVRQDAHPDGNRVRGYVYHDVDSDGVKDSGEGAISGVTVKLLDASGAVVATTTTNSSGRYSFANVPSGTYTVSEVQASGYVDGKDTVGSLGGVVSGLVGDDTISQVTLSGYQFAENYNFGEVKLAKLSGYVYKDLDNDAKKESGESGIKSVKIKLSGTDDFGNAVTMELCTNSSGYYEFAGLRPGVYSIQEVDPSGYNDGKESLGTLGGVKWNDLFTDIVVKSAANGQNYNFGELKVSYC